MLPVYSRFNQVLQLQRVELVLDEFDFLLGPEQLVLQLAFLDVLAEGLFAGLIQIELVLLGLDNWHLVNQAVD